MIKISNLKNEFNLDNINDEILSELNWYLKDKVNHIKDIYQNISPKYKNFLFKKFIFGNYNIELLFLGTFYIWNEDMLLFYVKNSVINNKHLLILEEKEFIKYCTLKND